MFMSTSNDKYRVRPLRREPNPPVPPPAQQQSTPSAETAPEADTEFTSSQNGVDNSGSDIPAFFENITTLRNLPFA